MMTLNSDWHHALRLARRELRGGLNGFKIFLACLILGVTTIAAVGALTTSIIEGLARDGEKLLGGDVDLRLNSLTISQDQQDYFTSLARLSHIQEMRAMAQGATARSLVELKSVDDFYPLVGTVTLDPSMDLQTALEDKGAVLDRILVERLGLSVGDQFRLGQTDLTLRAIIEKEPDRVASVINFGPRVMINQASLNETGLVQPGSIIRHHYRLDFLEPRDPADFVETLNQRYPEAGWRIRTPDNAAPRVENFVERLALFLSFVGFTTLLIGGIGISAGVKDYLDGKIATIATLKCLGAPSSIVFKTYLIQVLILACIGIAIGLIFGALVPNLAATLGADFFPVQPETGLFITPLLTAFGFGLLSTLTFTLWPLGRAQDVPARSLFRDKSTPIQGVPARKYKYASYGSLLLLVFLILGTAYRVDYALIFIIASLLVMGALSLTGRTVVWAAQRVPKPDNNVVRMALASLYRPGSRAPAVILSLGLGLSVLVTIAQIDQNLRDQIGENVSAQAPTYFFVDIQSNQKDQFDQALANLDGTSNYQRVPTVRARITHINTVASEKATVAPDAQWAIRGDRALTYAAEPSENAMITKGSWWPADYAGPPLVSLDEGIAEGFGVDIGDTLTVNVLGRDITAEIANLRAIDWQSMRFDFALIFSPGLLENAPHTHIAALFADEASERTVEQITASDFPNVSVIRVKDALEAAEAIMDGISTAIAIAASFTVAAGILVLSGAMASGRERRTYEAIVFKVLGATRLRLLSAYMVEYGLLGLVTAVISIFVGSLASYGVVQHLMNLSWRFFAESAALTLLICLILTLTAGFIGTWQALGQKAAPHLRNE